jgi:glycosyltransferase involved in cell wall biosynthesis
MKPRVSIIITTRNRAGHLCDTLGSFNGLHVPEHLPTELLVVDNASTDETGSVIKSSRLLQLPIRYLFESKPGQSNARNSGMANTTGEVILFTDDDVHVPEDWLESMSKPILSAQTDAVAGGVSLAKSLLRPWMSSRHKGWLASTEGLNSTSPQSMFGANMAFRRDVLTKVPNFDPELGPGGLGFGDDYLFSVQLLKAGYRICSNFGCAVEHHFSETRLTRSSWLEAARKRGSTRAFLSYHWSHGNVSFPALRRFVINTTLKSRRLYKRDWMAKEGCPDWELLAVRDAQYYKQYAVEKTRERVYDMHGLVKMRT